MLIPERLLVAQLHRHISARIYLDWVAGDHPPHHSYNNYGAFALAFDPKTIGPYGYYRGFFSSLVVRDGDKVLDISCGDGFFSKRFFGVKASHVDAIDIERDAIDMALRYNADPKVSFFVRDAVEDPFPSNDYDVVIWDGGIAHFAPGTTEGMFKKIKAAMRPGGVFAGSETLGFDGSEDHLQRWDTLEEVRAMLAPNFRYVELYETEYFYNRDRTGRRGEFYWRCSDDAAALNVAAWQRHDSH